jgi:RimJ/RimL family protein N-acetyltransferase
MVFRPATLSDIPALLPMVAALAALHQSWDPAKFGYRPNPERMYQNWMAAKTADPHAVFLVAAREAVPVGFLIATVESEVPVYSLKEYGFIHDIWVEPPYRNEGIARQLVMLAIEKFRSLGVRQVRADTAAANDAARGLFTSCGMRPSTIEMLIEV